MDRAEKMGMYREMLLIRRFEERASQMYEAGKVRGFLHLYIGQEAVSVGFLWAARGDDYVMGAYRDHGQALSRCADPKRVMAELFGKSTGVSGGKGGSMHIFDRERRFLGGTAIVGGGLPLATGAGFAIEYSGGDEIVLCFFGDGAVNEGAFHESLNVASLWNLPVLFICENNLYGMGTAVSRASSTPSMYQRAQCYAMPVDRVDGMDVEACHDAAARWIDDVRKNRRPAFIEAETYRFRGHSMADPGTYRTKEEIELWQQRDPIVTFAAHLTESEEVKSDEFAAVESEVLRTIDEAVDFAEKSPLPDADELYTDVYASTGGLR